ncbi:DUF2523 domain-containing protein [Chromobacterium haemolyticum]|uniref:DUF2523 domain-containing protein n=1 Tax=Chromobacterium haemolyticum TaxID=394935 RepID=UPI002449C90F|nr:DUF2523 domain-containing protein [Chromobacterium haemolyticum]MDH0340247.1 DUF2523 domain-containing protein [Chromobacterium haemolyticum]
MPLILSICAAVVTALLTNIVSRVIGAIGFGMVGYAGASAVLDLLKSLISQNLNAATSLVFAILSMAGFGQGLSIIFSALVMRATLAGMDSAGNIMQSKWKGFGK